MVKFFFHIQKNSIYDSLEKKLRENIRGEVFISKASLFHYRMNQTLSDYCNLVIVDIDEYEILPERLRMSEDWKDTYFIYLSKDSEKSMEAYGYNILGYYLYDQLDLLTERITKLLKILSMSRDCYFKTDDGIRLFRFKDIVLIERLNRKIYLHTDRTTYRLINYNLKDIFQLLDDRFCQINQSMIVNRDKILAIHQNNEIEVKINGEIQILKASDKNVLTLNKKTGKIK